MDELNAHQFWGISPFLDLLAACEAGGAEPRVGADCGSVLLLLQACPYDCRHTLATLSAHMARQAAVPQQEQQQQQRLELFVYEAEPEVLARHMLLLALLFDGRLTVRARAEMLLELHGNALLRQRTADWLVAASRRLEAAVAQLSLASTAICGRSDGGDRTALGCGPPAAAQQQQQQQEAGDLGVLAAFDLSCLRYQERDALLEAFKGYRSKAGFDMAAAWDGRCRQWYGERFDCRANLVDWDYHMRLAQRGTPFVDPAAGSIVHFYHFRHWRLTGVAHELRDCSYTAPNTSLLATAYGRTREHKDRHLRDVGRSVAARGLWCDITNSPYHAFGTVVAAAADEPALLRQANKQFAHTALDVAEHNALTFMEQLRGAPGSTGATGGDAVDSPGGTGDGHRANAARGPTSIANLSATAQPDAADSSSQDQAACQQGQQAQEQQVQEQQAQEQQAQEQQAQAQAAQEAQEAAERLAAAEAALTAAAARRLAACTRIHLLTGDLNRGLSSRHAKLFAGRFAAATVGHRHVHLLAPGAGIAGAVAPGGLVLVESAHNMLQLSQEQAAAFEAKVLELARPAGLAPHPSLRAAGAGAPAGAPGGCRPAILR